MDSKKELISILMPVRNAGAFLSPTLHSICRQTESNWELIAIDDCSTDNSEEILQYFAQKDRRIKVFRNIPPHFSGSSRPIPSLQNGIISSLRMALSKSSGQLITRMDADDIMPPEKLHLLKQKLLAFGPGHVSTGMVEYFSDQTLGQGYKKYQTWLNSLVMKENHFQEIYKECVIPSPCWMIYRTDLESCRAFNPGKYPEDYDLCFRFYQNGLKVVPVKQICHYWRDHAERSSRTDKLYSNQQYFDLKLPYFLSLDYTSGRPLVLWGAGKKGKLLAKKLQARKLQFEWICDNPKKLGKEIYGIQLQHFLILQKLKRAQIIIAVASPVDQKFITQFLVENNFKASKDYFFFC